MEEVASDEDVRLAVDAEFTASAQHLNEHVARGAVLGESLAFGESEEHHTSGAGGQKCAADDAIVGVDGFGGKR